MYWKKVANTGQIPFSSPTHFQPKSNIWQQQLKAKQLLQLPVSFILLSNINIILKKRKLTIWYKSSPPNTRKDTLVLNILYCSFLKKKKEFPRISNLSLYLCLKVEHPCSNFILSKTLLKLYSSSPLTRNFHIFSSSTNPNPLTLIKVEAPTSHQFSSLFSFRWSPSVTLSGCQSQHVWS